MTLYGDFKLHARYYCILSVLTDDYTGGREWEFISAD
jgi:hypothetical protein